MILDRALPPLLAAATGVALALLIAAAVALHHRWQRRKARRAAQRLHRAGIPATAFADMATAALDAARGISALRDALDQPKEPRP